MQRQGFDIDAEHPVWSGAADVWGREDGGRRDVVLAVYFVCGLDRKTRVRITEQNRTGQRISAKKGKK